MSLLNNNELRIQNLLYIILLLMQPFMLIALVFEYQDLERLINYLIYITALAFFVMRFLKTGIKKEDLCLLVFLLFYLFKILIFKEGTKSIITFLAFFSMLVAFGAGNDVTNTKIIKQVIISSYILQAIIFCGLSLSEYAYKAYAENTDIADVLTLGISNPNQTGIMLFVNIFVLWAGLETVKKKWQKLFLFVLWLWLVVLLFLTNARTSIITFILAYLFYFIFKKDKQVNIQNGLLKSFLIVSFPLLFLMFYITAYDIEFFQDIVLFGKDLFSGRENLYRDVLNNWDNIMLGNISEFSFDNAHNAYLSILVNLGIIGFLFYFVFIINKIQRIAFCEKLHYSIVYWGVLGVFLIACTESALLTGGTIYFIMLFTLCFLLKTKENN